MEQINENTQEEQTNQETESLDFSRPDFVFVPKGNHLWRQNGPYIVCKSCEVEHASWVGVEKTLVGIDEKGQPILKKKIS